MLNTWQITWKRNIQDFITYNSKSNLECWQTAPNGIAFILIDLMPSSPVKNKTRARIEKVLAEKFVHNIDVENGMIRREIDEGIET